MARRLSKMIMKLFFGTLMLYWINYPDSPLSIPVFWSGDFHWWPIFNPEYVLQYQIFFSLTTSVSIMISALEFVFYIFGKMWEISDEIVGIIGLLIVREIPREAFHLPIDLSDKVFTAGYWFINFILFLAVLGVIIKTFQWLSVKNFINSK